MSEWIIDTSVLIKAYIQQPETPQVWMLLNRLALTPPDKFHLPEFGVIECTNTLWKYVRFDGMPLPQAQISLAQLKQLPLTLHIARPYMEQALKIGATYHLAIYDSIYIALAQVLRKLLITLDTKQAAIAQKVGVTLKSLSDFTE